MAHATTTRDLLYVAMVLLAALLLITGALSPPPRLAPGGGFGRARATDLPRLRQLIRQGTLSDHEAEYYRVVTE